MAAGLTHATCRMWTILAREMTNSDIEDWDRIASTYSDGAGTLHPFYREVEEYVWPSLGDPRGKRILDLGAGDGWFAHELVTKGAEVVAIDGSAKLIERGKTTYPEVEFLQYDLTRGLPEMGRFDAVWCFTVLMDLPSVDALLRDTHRVLKPEGSFLITILHPCFFNFPSEFDESTQTGFRKIDRYLREETWRLDAFGGHNHYHRSITFYSEALRAAGFVISRLIEPPHIPARHDCDFYRDIPVLLFIEAKRLTT